MVENMKKELLVKIEEKREKIYNLVNDETFAQKEVLRLSQQLDKLLNKFYQ